VARNVKLTDLADEWCRALEAVYERAIVDYQADQAASTGLADYILPK